MKNKLKYLTIVLFMTMFTSCLKSGLDDLPTFNQANITNFKFEYRWMGKNAENDQLHVYQMDVVNSIDTIANTVDCIINVPAVSTDFPSEVRDAVQLSNIVGYCSVSNAATIHALEGTPELGKMEDFSGSNLQYEVIAADGTSKVWTISISEFNK